MLYHVRKLRSVLSVDSEYRIRRALCSVIPAKSISTNALFHCCVHKTASQWVRLLLSDPRFYRHTGLKPYFAPILNLNDPDRREPIRRKSVVTGLYTNKENLVSLEKPQDWRAFFVTRNPRDLLISRYFSARFSHRTAPRLEELRKSMEGMSDEDGLIFTIENNFDVLVENMRSFATPGAEDARIKVVKFEDLTGADQIEAWTTLFASIDIPIPESTVAALLDFYRVDRLRSPKSAGQKTEKYRMGKEGDWKSHFTDRVASLFDERYGELSSLLGYSG